MIKFDYVQTSERLYPKEGTCPLDIILNAFPSIVVSSIKAGNCWIAGGFIRRWWGNIKQDSDIDLFFSSKETYDIICTSLDAEAEEPCLVSEFNRMYTIKINDEWTINVQCIHHQFYANTEALLDSFDFTICQFAYDGTSICTTELTIIDSQRKRLVPHKITFGVSSLRRIVKYSKQGYYMCGGAATSFLNQIKPENIRGEVISLD